MLYIKRSCYIIVNLETRASEHGIDLTQQIFHVIFFSHSDSMIKDERNQNLMFFVMFSIILVFLSRESLLD
jgi:hypothetical protein